MIEHREGHICENRIYGNDHKNRPHGQGRFSVSIILCELRLIELFLYNG
jgi:hypothetical protein